jgi:glycosyltransferase involved in cell wall biosynthesis
MAPSTACIVTAHNEADRLGATLAALAEAFPGARVLVADDGSTDGGAAVAEAAGAEVVRSERPRGKGGTATLAAERLLVDPPDLVVLADGDLAETAGRLGPVADAVRRGEADLAVADFTRRVGGGFGLALGFARWAIRSRSGLELRAPISGQRAMSGAVLQAVVPFAPRFGMEIGMTVDAARAGFRVVEVPVDLAHRATGRTLQGFAHRARQLGDFAAVWWSRR